MFDCWRHDSICIYNPSRLNIVLKRVCVVGFVSYKLLDFCILDRSLAPDLTQFSAPSHCCRRTIHRRSLYFYTQARNAARNNSTRKGIPVPYNKQNAHLRRVSDDACAVDHRGDCHPSHGVHWEPTSGWSRYCCQILDDRHASWSTWKWECLHDNSHHPHIEPAQTNSGEQVHPPRRSPITPTNIPPYSRMLPMQEAVIEHDLLVEELLVGKECALVE